MKRNISSGFSLVSALVSIALLSLAALTSLTVFRTNLMQQKFVDQSYSVASLHNQIFQQLTNSVACTATFSGAQLLNRDNIDNPPGETFPITVIKNSTGTVDAFKTYSSASDPIYEGNMIKIQAMVLKSYEDQGLVGGRYAATATLGIRYLKNMSTVGADLFKEREIKIQFVFKRTAPGPDLANDREVYTCTSIGSGTGDTFWSLTGSGDGIYYNGGKVGIGTVAPAKDLDVGGDLGVSGNLDVGRGIRAGSQAVVTACGPGMAAGEGMQRYNYIKHRMEYCNGTGWIGTNLDDQIRVESCNHALISGQTAGCTATCNANETVTGGGFSWGSVMSGAGRTSRVSGNGWHCSINITSCTSGTLADGCGSDCYALCALN